MSDACRYGVARPASRWRGRRRIRRGRSRPRGRVPFTWVPQQQDQRARALRDAGAEEVGRAGPEEAAGRDRVRAVAPASDHSIGRVHCVFRFGPCRPVEEGGLELAPPPFEVDPRERLLRGSRLRGIVTTFGRSSRCGPRVSSQPTPASAELPR